jgi:hypothetical protein
MDDEFNFALEDDFGSNVQKKNNLNLKKYVGPIIKIIILLGILLFLAWFFFLRYTEVSFSVITSDTSRPISSGIIYLNDKTYNLDEQIRLIPGEYDLRLSEIDEKKYFLIDDYIEITKEDSEIELIAYPLEFKKLSGFTATLPTEIYENQLLIIPITITNSNDSTTNITILGDNGFKSLNQDFTLNKGTNNFNVTFQNTTAKGSTLSGSIYVENAKGLRDLTKSISLKVIAAPSLKYKNFKSSYTATAGQDLEINLEIDNPSIVNITNLNLDFDNASLDTDLLKSWVTDSTKDLNIIPKGIGSAKVILRIPLDTTVKDEYFDIIYKNSYSEVRQKLTISIKEPEIITPKLLDFGKITAGQNLIQKDISLENKTNYPINITDFAINITTSQPKNPILNLEGMFSADVNTSIAANSASNIMLNLIIPPTYVSDNITGNIVLKTDYFEIKVPFKLEILELNIKLDVEGLSNSYKFAYTQNNNTMSESKSYILNLQNNGNIDLEINSIAISPECGSMLSTSIFVNYPFILKPTLKQEFTLTLKPISNALLQGEKTCTINVNYKNPITKLNDIFTKIFLIS